MDKIKIAVTGAAGRMGRELIRAVHAMEGCVVGGAIEQEGSLALGQDAGLLAGLGKLGVVITDDALELFAKVDAVLDFTVPAASVEFAGLAANARIVHVLGTTGLTPEDDVKIRAAANHAAIIRSGNMSLGVNLLAALTRKVAEALDADFDIEILEMHHRHKIDAPSGTALMLGKAAAEGRGVKLDDVSVRVRDGHTGERKRGDIGFATLRGRQRRRRAHRDVCRRRRGDRTHPPRRRSRHLRARRRQGRPVGPRQAARPLFHGGRARHRRAEAQVLEPSR